jgi:hypothetical protein
VGTPLVGWVMGWGSSFMWDDVYCGRKKYNVFEVGLTEFEGKARLRLGMSC